MPGSTLLHKWLFFANFIYDRSAKMSEQVLESVTWWLNILKHDIVEVVMTFVHLHFVLSLSLL